MPEGAWLYRLLDSDGKLLYVGISRSPASRFMQHSRKQWWPAVMEMKLQRYETDAAVMDAEVTAIHEENPRYNIRTDRWRIDLEPVPAATTTGEALPVGGLEIASHLAVRPRTVAIWKQRGLLPPARWTVSGEDAWDWAEDIQPWAERTRRWPPNR